MSKHGQHLERNRKYSIVIHDVEVDEDPKATLKLWVISLVPIYYMIALEPYEHQEGFHMHLFVQFSNQMSKFKMLKTLETLFKGRIQIDPGRGSRDECIRYITDPLKTKSVDTNIINEVGIPKVRIHNHELDLPIRNPRRQRCPRCQWLAYVNSIASDKEFLEEHRKPYTDYNSYKDIPKEKLKYWG